MAEKDIIFMVIAKDEETMKNFQNDCSKDYIGIQKLANELNALYPEAYKMVKKVFEIALEDSKMFNDVVQTVEDYTDFFEDIEGFENIFESINDILDESEDDDDEDD